jgi:fermentation-respiration switch protein FrsA (DUF1100 family)
MAHRPSDWRDNIGAIAGGVAGSAAMIPFGPGSGAAVGAATTTAVRNAMHGGSTSLEDLGRSAAAGRAIGAVAALGGRQLSQNLSMQAKGRLGESLGAVRSAINRMEREPGPKRLFKPDPAKPGTFADGQSGDILFEDKFGPKAALSAGQRLAQKILGPNYIVYHWHPEDVGKIVALPFTGLAPQLLNWRPAVRHPQSPPARR